MHESLYDQFYDLESKHWWFVARRSIIVKLIERYLPRKEDNAILDIGCGTGLMMMHLRRFGTVLGFDSSLKAVSYSRYRGAKACYGSLPNDVPIIFTAYRRFDLITVFDVLEHIEADTEALAVIHRMLRDDGLLICTVPAWPFLWSRHDEVNNHKRRYSKHDLVSKFVQTGFRIKRISYFNTLLAPLVIAVRLIRKISLNRDLQVSDVSMPNRPLNMMLKYLFQTEGYLLPHLDLPFGISLVCIAERSDKS